MELRPVPRPKPMSRGLAVAVTCATVAPFLLLVLLPAALGLQRYVVSSDALAGSVGRGSLILAEQVPVTDLRPGDVISFVPPAPYDRDGMTTRRVVRVGPGVVTTADRTGSVDPWRLPTSGPGVSRMIVHLPWLGYPLLRGVDRGTWALMVVVSALVVVLAAAGGGLRRRRASLLGLGAEEGAVLVRATVRR